MEAVDEAIAALRDLTDLCKTCTAMPFFKGSALNIGFGEFANLCQAGEAAAVAGLGEDVEIAAMVQSYVEAGEVCIN